MLSRRNVMRRIQKEKLARRDEYVCSYVVNLKFQCRQVYEICAMC